jgi:transcriptional regulator with XRE-family HTH domain
MMLALKSKSNILLIIGGRLKAERLLQNLTQQDLAQRSGVAYSTLRRIESSGEGSMSDYISILTALGKIEQVNNFMEEPKVNPEKVYKLQGRIRSRATGSHGDKG